MDKGKAFTQHRIGKWFITGGLMLLVFVCAAFPWSSASADEQDTVKVGYYENEVFQEGAAEDAVKKGYAYEYYLKLSEYTGWKYDYVYGSYGDLYQMLLDGDIDLLAGLAYTEEREGLIGYPQDAMGSETYSLVKHDTDGITTDPATIEGKRIGVLDSAMVGILQEWLETKEITAEVVTFADYEELFTAFDNHDVDILAAEGDGAYGREHAEVLCPFGSSDYYLCVDIGRPDLLEQLNAAQTQLLTDDPNYISTLRNKYYPVSVSSRAFSAAETEWIDTHDSLKVGYLNNYLPYSDTDEKGNATGVVKDLLPHMLQQMGLADIRVSYQGYDSYDDMVRAVNKGTIDTAFPVGGGLYFSEENGIYQTSPVISAAMEFVYRGEYSKEKTRSFAVNENNRMQHYYVITEYPDAQIHLYPSIDDCLDAVKSGEVGGTVLNGMRANDILRNDEYRELSMRQMSRSDDRCFGVKIGNDGLLRILNRGISIIGADYATNISYRYTEALYDVTLMDMIRKNMVAVGAFLLAIAALIIFLLVRESRQQKRARIETDNANRAKTAFLNNMSHDIRTPMNAIVGFTSLAKTHLDDKEQVEEYLDKISVSSQHLLSLINDVLDMSRIESGKVTIEETEVHLPDLLRDLRTIVQPAAASKNQSFIVDTEGVKTKDIITDKLRLNQILLNLLTNAIKFTPEGGMVCFQVTEKPSDTDGAVDFTFRIEDNGVGMSEEFQRTIFEAFTREKSSTASGIQGTGLGMAITKNIVDMMGGTITIRSEEDKGTEVTVDLTCRIDDGRTRPDPAPQTEADFTGRRILLAEDNELNQMIAVRMLEDFGFTIEVAGDGQEAVDKMREASAGHYDIVLMDIQMPNMDGYEAARQIRALEDPKKAGIPIIAVTANAFEEDRRTALDAGMNGHLAKPYDVPKMIEVLSEELRQGESAEGKGAGDAR